MLFVYDLGIKIYILLIRFSSLFNKKASLWIKGRKDIFSKISSATLNRPFWFHFASLGEFEQGRPVVEKLKALYPEKKILITFFSPSGYEVRKNYPLADLVIYLPADTRKNAARFVRSVNPEIAVFTKYEYWYHYFKELKQNKASLYVISAIFRLQQSFFKWYGSLNREILSFVDHFFVQDEESKQLLETIGLRNASVSGDTRFDRVFENTKTAGEILPVKEFCGSSPVFIAGSSWPPDEKLIATLPSLYPGWQFIIAPHEISEEKIGNLCKLFPAAIRYSELTRESERHHSPLTTHNPQPATHNLQPTTHNPQLLIIDNIGMLSALYQYAAIAYIGGGFGAGIHNTLEAAAFGMPVIFGPNYQKFREARELIQAGAAFSISDATGLQKIMADLQDEEYRKKISDTAEGYVSRNIGATETIISYITRIPGK